MRVGVILDVPHVEPWAHGMEEFLPIGQLVVITGSSPSGALIVFEEEGKEDCPFHLHHSSVEILGDL